MKQSQKILKQLEDWVGGDDPSYPKMNKIDQMGTELLFFMKKKAEELDCSSVDALIALITLVMNGFAAHGIPPGNVTDILKTLATEYTQDYFDEED